MKVSVRFDGTGLQLRLLPENEAERRMVGAVLNHQPEDHGHLGSPIPGSLLQAAVCFEGHHSNRSLSEVSLTVHRQEPPT